MAKSFPQRRLFEILLAVASPALIVAMVASLVFFLIEILYRGPHVMRLNVIMALFTMATVLISRISIESGQQRAALFAGGLAIATLATTSVIVEFKYQQWAWLEPVVIVLLIATVMGVSNQLVWDCTLIGPRRDVSAMGLIEVILQKLSPRRNRPPNSDSDSDLNSPRTLNSNSNSNSSAASVFHPPHRDRPTPDAKRRTSFGLFRFFLGRNGRSSTPGLWVFYLAMAAFPIFGMGQWFYRPGGNGFSAFFLFFVYLSTGLGLLLVTSLLGLKRYVNQRGITIPDAIAMNWLFVGTLFLAGFLSISLLLPRPDLRSTFRDYLAVLSGPFQPSAQPNEMALGNDNDPQDQPEGKPGDKPADKPADQPGNEAGVDTHQDHCNDPPRSDRQGKQPGQTGQQGGSQDNGNGNDNGNGKNKPSRPKQSNAQADAKQADAKQADANADQGQANADQNQQPQNDPPDPNPNPNPNAAAADAPRGQAPQPPPPVSPKLPSGGQQSLVTFFVLAVLGLIVFLYRQQIAQLWRRLINRSDARGSADDHVATTQAMPRPMPFSSYANPFAASTARKMTPLQLMNYSLSALQAFARLYDVKSSPDTTVEELANAIQHAIGDAVFKPGPGETSPATPPPVDAFAATFNRTVYGSGTPNAVEMAAVKRLWQFMSANANPEPTGR